MLNHHPRRKSANFSLGATFRPTDFSLACQTATNSISMHLHNSCRCYSLTQGCILGLTVFFPPGWAQNRDCLMNRLRGGHIMTGCASANFVFRRTHCSCELLPRLTSRSTMHKKCICKSGQRPTSEDPNNSNRYIEAACVPVRSSARRVRDHLVCFVRYASRPFGNPRASAWFLSK